MKTELIQGSSRTHNRMKEVNVKTELIRGNNRMLICPATMQAIIQAWLDVELKSPVEVTGVEWAGGSGSFEVKFKRAEGADT
jgi:hypothetical protein